MFEIPPYPVLNSPFLIEYTSMIMEDIQKKYNIQFRIVTVPFNGFSSPSMSPSSSSSSTSTTTYSTYSSPSSPEKKPTSPSNSNPICQCTICGKKFSRQWLLQGHLRTHTGEKPFKCEICDKHFADKSNLRAHTQTHSGVKPHKCHRCGKRFALKSYLTKHEESKCSRPFNWP